MKISIENFKSIKLLKDFELKPLTILSGINSSGKSSFIQLLLLIKQTLDHDSAKNQLFLKGDHYEINEFKDIISGKNFENKLKIIFEFTKEEDILFNSQDRQTIFDSFDTYLIRISVAFDYIGEKIVITDFMITYVLPAGDKREQFVKFKTIHGEKDNFSIEANNLIFGNELWGPSPNITDLVYSSIFPTWYEITETEISESTKKDQKAIKQEKVNRYLPKIAGIKSMLDNKFASFSYIGPLREQPKDEYALTSQKRHVGKLGQFTAQILENFADESIEFMKPIFSEDEVTYKIEKSTLLVAVKYWMCDVFKIGVDIYAKKNGDSVSVFLQNEGGIETTIKHVGFGISQILPIVVEGLIMERNRTLILEQPEIHLHPKIQSLLFDFLYSLILNKKNIIIETHSDHFITRMRRRVAESRQEGFVDNVSLTFIDTDKGEVLFEIIELDDMGTLDYFPDDFIEQSNLELKAIVRAQMRKRTQK